MNKKTTPVKQKKIGFWGWVHKYRLKIVALSFIVLVPLALLAAVYIGSYTNNRKIYFDQEQTNETVIISKYRKVNPDKLDQNEQYYYEIEDINDQFDLFILWKSLNLPYLNSETGSLDFGQYTFNMFYKPNDGVTINTLHITPLLQTDWVSIRSLGNKVPISQSPSNDIIISFNFRMPQRPLPLVTVESPNLYLKIEYQMTIGGQPIDKTVYVQFDLENANPRQVS